MLFVKCHMKFLKQFRNVAVSVLCRRPCHHEKMSFCYMGGVDFFLGFSSSHTYIYILTYICLILCCAYYAGGLTQSSVDGVRSVLLSNRVHVHVHVLNVDHK